MEEILFQIDWIGPVSNDKFEEYGDSCCLYKIYGTHPIYGRNVLIYLGMTKSNIANRISQHKDWIDLESDDVTFYFGSISELKEKTKIAISKNNEAVRNIEELLIMANQPAYNNYSKKYIKNNNIRIFNSGKFGSLLPESSTLYYNDYIKNIKYKTIKGDDKWNH